MIFCHLLVYPRALGIGWLGLKPPVAIFRASRSIHSEAFDILYRENKFAGSFTSSRWSIIQNPRILETVQNIEYNVSVCSGPLAGTGFLKLMYHFGAPSTIRGTLRGSLTVNFSLDARFRLPLEWFVRPLRRFTNFQTIELHVYRYGRRVSMLKVLDYLEAALKPVLGDAEDCSRAGNGLRFYPIDHRNRCKEPDDGHGDWGDFLDGIRLRCNDEITNAEGFQPSVLN